MALSQEKGSPFVDYQDDVDLGFSGDVDGGGGGSSSNSVARTRQDYADDSDVIVVDADNNVIWIKEDHNEQPQDYDEPTSTIDPGVLAKLDLELAMQIDAAQRQTAARRGTRRQDMGKVGRFFLDTSDLWRDRYSLRSSERRTYGQWTIWLLSFVQSCIFIAELAVGGFAPPQENWMLGPNAGVCAHLGARYLMPIGIDADPIWRQRALLPPHRLLAQRIPHLRAHLPACWRPPHRVKRRLPADLWLRPQSLVGPRPSL